MTFEVDQEARIQQINDEACRTLNGGEGIDIMVGYERGMLGDYVVFMDCEGDTIGIPSAQAADVNASMLAVINKAYQIGRNHGTVIGRNQLQRDLCKMLGAEVRS